MLKSSNEHTLCCIKSLEFSPISIHINEIYAKYRFMFHFTYFCNL